METEASAIQSSPPATPLVALAGWLVPGAGYWLIGQRSRAVTVGVTIFLLFIGGLWIGGIRVLEVPYYDRLGQQSDAGLLAEVRSKPWSVAQVMTGPLGIVSGYLAVQASQPNPANPNLIYNDREESALNPHQPYGAESHARVNEIAVLYTAVAGMLNLLAIIDAAARAEKMGSYRAGAGNVRAFGSVAGAAGR